MRSIEKMSRVERAALGVSGALLAGLGLAACSSENTASQIVVDGGQPTSEQPAGDSLLRGDDLQLKVVADICSVESLKRLVAENIGNDTNCKSSGPEEDSDETTSSAVWSKNSNPNAYIQLVEHVFNNPDKVRNSMLLWAPAYSQVYKDSYIRTDTGGIFSIQIKDPGFSPESERYNQKSAISNGPIDLFYSVSLDPSQDQLNNFMLAAQTALTEPKAG